MFKNYFKVTVRNLLKNSVYSMLNIGGLAIGITSFILIMLWVRDEVSFDKAIPKYEKLTQIWVNAHFDGSVTTWQSVPLPTYEAFKTASTHIQNTTVTSWPGTYLVTYEDTPLNKEGFYVSEEFLEMFEYPLIFGDAATVLDEPNSIVLTESLAKAFFGEEDPIGKVLRLENKADVKVTGLLKDIPKNSSFQFEFLVPWKLRAALNEWVVQNESNWGNYSFTIFVELDDMANLGRVNDEVKNMLSEHGEDDMPRELFLYPMERWRLYSSFENGVETGGRSDYVNLFSIVALFVLIIACINFMNLATARSERRAREVGIRKSVGSGRWQLIFQFLGESLVISSLAFVLAVILAQLSLPFYNEMVDKQLNIPFASPEFWIFGFTIILLTGLFSGSYPAFYLSSFQPAKVLKGALKAGKGASTPRKVLVTLQFGFSVLLLIGTIVIYNQISLVKGRELGYDQENLISVLLTDDIEKNYKVIKQELINSGEAVSVTRSNSKITSINSNNFLGWPGKPEDLRVLFTTITCDYDYAKTMGIKLVEGREFSEDFKSDTAAIVVNRAALKVMNLPEPVLGTELDLWGNKLKLIGVVDDVIMGSVFQEVKPMFMILENWGGWVTIRLRKTNDIQQSLARVQDVFEKYNSAYPFEYTFMDEDFKQKFTSINMTARISQLFAVLTVIITGLGLLGLASFMAEQRTKEIGIRKVLGASVPSLLALMSKDFSKLVIIAFGLTAPLAWYLLNSYLERYPVRTEIDWWVFPVTGLVIFIFSITIVSLQAFRAARANPATSLRVD